MKVRRKREKNQRQIRRKKTEEQSDKDKERRDKGRQTRTADGKADVRIEKNKLVKKEQRSGAKYVNTKHMRKNAETKRKKRW